MRPLICVLAGLTVLSGVPAQAEDTGLMNRLERYCMATSADTEAAVRIARADGMVRPPEGITPSIANMENVKALWSVHDGGAVLLIAGDMQDRRTGFSGTACAVASIPQQPDAVKQLERSLGVRFGAEDFILYVDEAGGGRRILSRSDDRAGRQALRDGSLRGAGARTDRQMTMLMVMTLRE